MEPFFIDEAPVTNKEFGKFVRATYYETEAEKFGWSFVLSSFLPNAEQLEYAEVDPEAVCFRTRASIFIVFILSMYTFSFSII